MVSNWLSLEPGETLHFDYQGDDGGALLLVSLQRQQGLDDDEPQLLQQPRRVHRTPTMGSGYSFFLRKYSSSSKSTFSLTLTSVKLLPEGSEY